MKTWISTQFAPDASLISIDRLYIKPVYHTMLAVYESRLEIALWSNPGDVMKWSRILASKLVFDKIEHCKIIKDGRICVLSQSGNITILDVFITLLEGELSAKFQLVSRVALLILNSRRRLTD